MAGDREYLDMKIFVEDHQGKKKPYVIGYQWLDDRTGEMAFKLTGLPMPSAKTDFSGKVEKRGQRNGGQSGGGGGGRQSAPRSSGGGSADFGPGAGDSDDIPFASQLDDTARRFG